MNRLYPKISLTLLATSLCISSLASANEFQTKIKYPDLTDGKAFGLYSNHAHKLLFYTGKKDGQDVNGYFRSAHFLGWDHFAFTPLQIYKADSKKILSVANGPANKTVVLSHVHGAGQFLSSTSNGKDWNTLRILNRNSHFENLASTNINGVRSVAAWGNHQQAFYTSFDTENWYAWQLPNGCSNDDCSYENKYFGDGLNNYVLLQTTKQFYNTNTLYFSTNLHDWYSKTPLPFASDQVQSVHKSHSELMAVSVVDQDKNHKLWLTEDLENWKSFDLPKDAKLADLDAFNNRIEMLLVYKKPVVEDPTVPVDPSSAPTEPVDNTTPADDSESIATVKTQPSTEPQYQTTTEFVHLDPEANTIHLLHKFDGEVTSMSYLDNKLYLVGNFANEKNHDKSILVGSNL